MKSKFRNVRVEIDGHKFASKAEARRYVQLRDQQDRGEIYGLCLQRRFGLYAICLYDNYTPAQDGNVSQERNAEKVCDYVADFTYYRDGTYTVEDVKGGATTDVFRLKKKMMRSCYGIDVIEVRV